MILLKIYFYKIEKKYVKCDAKKDEEGRNEVLEE